MSSLLLFILLIGGKLIFQHFWSRFVTFVNAEPCSLSIPLLLIISTLTRQAPVPPATPPQGAVIMHPSRLVDKDKNLCFCAPFSTPTSPT